MEKNDKISKELKELYTLAYKHIKPTVSYIIKNNIKDVDFIENTLDSLLDIPTEKGSMLFMKLCDYYKEIHPRNAKEYLELFQNKKSYK